MQDIVEFVAQAGHVIAAVLTGLWGVAWSVPWWLLLAAIGWILLIVDILRDTDSKPTSVNTPDHQSQKEQ